jgi:hypothetical protein
MLTDWIVKLGKTHLGPSDCSLDRQTCQKCNETTAQLAARCLQKKGLACVAFVVNEETGCAEIKNANRVIVSTGDLSDPIPFADAEHQVTYCLPSRSTLCRRQAVSTPSSPTKTSGGPRTLQNKCLCYPGLHADFADTCQTPPHTQNHVAWLFPAR